MGVIYEYYNLSSVKLVYALSEDGMEVSKLVGVVQDYTDVFVITAFVWLCGRIF
jgi:hypothetical protein